MDIIFQRIKEIFASTKLIWILVISNILLFGCYLMVEDWFQLFFFKENPTKTKGDLLTIYMGVIGGLGVFYGFYINSKKLEEQNVQNKIAEQNKNDKRFTDAVNFLKDDNPGVVLSGVKTLFQIAQQDLYYRQIVAILFGEHLSFKDKKQRDRRVDDVVLDYLFYSEVFKDIHIELDNINFSELSYMFKPIVGFKHISFTDCKNIAINKKNINSIEFENCSIKNLVILETSNIRIKDSRQESYSLITSKSPIDKLYFFNNNIESIKVIAYNGINDLLIYENVIEKELTLNYSIVNQKSIEKNEGIIKEAIN